MDTGSLNLPEMPVTVKAEGSKESKHVTIKTPYWLFNIDKTAPSYGINASLPGALFNDVDVNRVFSREKPVHRVIAELAAAGLTHREIASQVGRSENNVSEVLRQPYARRRIIESARKNVTDELKSFLESEVLPTIREVAEMGRDPNISPAVRLQCKQEVMNRFLGRPTQPITTGENDPKKLSNDELERQVQSIIAGVSAATPDTDQP